MPPSSLAGRALSVAVGLFCLWQMAFLVLDNALDFVPLRPRPADVKPVLRPFQEHGTFTSCEPLQSAVERVGRVCTAWSELTGQEQGWSLFAPGFPPCSVFPAVELRFADGTTETLRSPFEPADLTNPGVRLPMLHNRPYMMEIQQTVHGWFCIDEQLAMYPDAWQERWPTAVRDNWRPLVKFLKWRADGYTAEHPDRLPVEVVLLFRYIPTPLPTEPRAWTKPVTERPFARWRPAVEPPAGELPVEGYDPVGKQFVRLRSEGQP